MRSEYEDLDDEMTNTWPSKSGGQVDMLAWLLVLVDEMCRKVKTGQAKAW